MAKSIVTDTGYWLALFDRGDQHYRQASLKAHYLEAHKIVFPWPILYETLGTRFVKNRSGMISFEKILKGRNALFINDDTYRDTALELTLRTAEQGTRSISLCDMMIRLMLEDTNLRIDGILTFNHKDFVDVCRARSVEVL